MGTRGPVSAAALAIVPLVQQVKRLEPPAELSDEQAAEWRKICGSVPADWFPPETQGLLVQYCRHSVAARRCAQLVMAIEKEPDFDVVAYDRALKMQEREGRAMSALANRMRLTQQTTTRIENAPHSRHARKGKRPWD